MRDFHWLLCRIYTACEEFHWLLCRIYTACEDFDWLLSRVNIGANQTLHAHE